MKVDIFDFDNTLVSTPGRELAEKTYLEAIGTPWPFIGFYGRPESLIPPCFPDAPDPSYLIAATAQACQESDADVKVMMTGRPYKMRLRVNEICLRYGLKFHETYFRGQPGCNNRGDTLEIKQNVIRDRFLILPLTRLRIWEDREEHADAFELMFNGLRQERPEVEFVVNRVLPVAC